MLKGKRILVTGGAGFIGSELVAQLARQGAEVRVVDNLANGQRANLDSGIELQVADIQDTDLAPLLKGIDIVYHLACLGVRHSLHSPLENHRVNAEGTLKLLIAARRQEVSRFVYVSSSEIYGTARSVPMTEDHPPFPHTVYGASKLAGECYTRAFHDAYGFPSVVLRPFNTYGPRCHHEGDSGEVIPKFVLRALVGEPLILFGDGTQTRDFTYVSDMAAGILFAGTTEGILGRTLNLGSGMEISINQLATKVGVALGIQPRIVYHPPRPGDVLRLYADASQARRLLGWEPIIPLSQGLKCLHQWYLQQPLSPQDLLQQETVRNWEDAQ